MSKSRPSAKDLQDKFSIKIASSGISAAHAKTLGLKALTAEESENLGHKAIPTLMIPYFDLNGKKSKFYRVRYLDSTKRGFSKQTEAKDQRYDQPKGETTEIYFPPLINWKKFFERDKPLYITEGELKAACATAKGFPTIGLGGVWNFCSRKKGIAMLPVFKEMKLANRDVYIVFDSDAATNPQVVAAENELCRQIANFKATPMIIRLPNLGDNKKTGLDDFLLSDEADTFEKLIENSTPFKLAEELLRLNEEVVYVENPSLVLRRSDGYKMSVTAFKNEVYADRTFIDFSGEKPKKVKTAEEWVKWEGRAKVNKFVYEPGKEGLVDGQYLNLWKGLPYEPKKGDVKPWLTLMEYMFKEDKAARKWFEQWLAYPLQHLGAKLFTAAVLWSVETGTGKTLIGHTMQRLYGADNSIMIRKQDLISGDNSFAENKQFVLGEEITGDERRGMVDDLKSLITNEELRVNIKFVPKYSLRSCVNYYFTSNNPDAFFLDETDRRFFVHEIVGAPLPEAWYTGVYDPWYKSDAGAAALLDYFLNIDLTGFSPMSRAPMTTSKAEMIENSRSVLGNWVHNLRDNPDNVLKLGAANMNYDLWSTAELLKIFDPEERGKVGVRALGVELKRARFYKAAKGIGCRTASGQCRLWAVRNPAKYVNISPTQAAAFYDEERKLGTKEKKFAKKGGK